MSSSFNPEWTISRIDKVHREFVDDLKTRERAFTLDFNTMSNNVSHLRTFILSGMIGLSIVLFGLFNISVFNSTTFYLTLLFTWGTGLFIFWILNQVYPLINATAQTIRSLFKAQFHMSQVHSYFSYITMNTGNVTPELLNDYYFFSVLSYNATLVHYLESLIKQNKSWIVQKHIKEETKQSIKEITLNMKENFNKIKIPENPILQQDHISFIKERQDYFHKYIENQKI